MEAKIECGQIRFMTEAYTVWWDSITKLVSVTKPDDEIFGESSYGRYTAETSEQAPAAAVQMLERVFAL
jgi:hypothetical protein